MLILLSHPLVYRANAELQPVEALALGYSVGLEFQELLHYGACTSWFVYPVLNLLTIHFAGQ